MTGEIWYKNLLDKLDVSARRLARLGYYLALGLKTCHGSFLSCVSWFSLVSPVKCNVK